MRTEVPTLRRCCCCLPMRYGLIVWGYIKLIITTLLIIYFFGSLYLIVRHLGYNKENINSDVIIRTVILFTSLVDLLLHIVFVVGVHRKHIKLLRAYYIYGIILILLTFLLLVVCIALIIGGFYIMFADFLGVGMVPYLEAHLINLFVQAYVVLLVRSEIGKLNNTRSLRLVNNAADGQCILYIQNQFSKGRTSNICEEKKVEEDSKLTICNEEKN